MRIDLPLDKHIPYLRQLWKEAFGDSDEFLDVFFKAAFGRERCLCAFCDDVPCAALYVFECSVYDRKIAYIYAVATAKKYRGNGISHKLMSEAETYLAQYGFEGAVLVPGSDSLFDFYGKMGYETFGKVSNVVCSAAEAAAQIRKISKQEYAVLRKRCLPYGGVIQEGENLEFLAHLSDFYAGDGYVLAGRVLGNKFFGTELLGDIGYAPGIVKALGCTHGNFRTFKDDVPFAMFKRIGSSKMPAPTYFGLAFD